MRPAATIAAAVAFALLLGACDGDESETVDTSGAAPAAADVCTDEGKGFKGEARLYIEHNATDEDTGVHGMFDQEGLVEGCLTKPDGTEIMLAGTANELGDLGINQFFFESREPPNDEYSIADLEADFPEGRYRISGTDFEGTQRVGSARFTHDIPAPPEIVGPPVADEEKAEGSRVPPKDLTVRWKPVTETLDGAAVEITSYEVIVTQEEYEDPNGLSRPEYDVHVPPDVTELTVPAEFLQPGTLYELEILALEKSGNQTISLGFFTTS